MKKLKIKFSAITILLVLFTYSCVSDTIDLDKVSEKTNREYSIDIPGGTIKTTIKDALDELDIDTIIKVDDNGLLYLNFQTDFEVEWPTILALDDQSGEFVYNITPPNPISHLKSTTGTGLVIENTEKIVFNDDEGIRLDSMILTDANMILDFDLPIGVIDSIIIDIPQLYTDNKPYSDTLKVHNFNNPYSIKAANSFIRFKHDTETPSGFIEFKTKIVLVEDLGIAPLSPASISYAITDIIPEVAYGYFGNREVENKEINIEFEIFNEEYLGTTIDFYDFLIDLDISSNYGAPYQVNISDIVFTNTNTNEEKTITLDNGADIVFIDGAEYSNPIINAEANLTLNRDNSSIENILQLGIFTPNKLSSNIIITANPNGETTTPNFLTNESKIKSTVNMNIPMFFKTSQFHRRDTIEFNYNEEFESEDDEIYLSEKLNKAAIYFDFENGMPFDINLQAYFIDENYVYVDSLFKSEDDQKLIQSAKTDETTGLVIEGTLSTFKSEITHENLTKWKDGDVRYIIIDTKVITDDGDKYVKISDYNYLNTTVSFTATAKIDE